MPINFSESLIDKIYKGSTAIKKVYKGSDLIWVANSLFMGISRRITSDTVNDQIQLYTVDHLTGILTAIGTLQETSPQDEDDRIYGLGMTFHNSRLLMMMFNRVDSVIANRLYEVNTGTGVLTLIGAGSLTSSNNIGAGLASHNSQLYLWGINPASTTQVQLYTVDSETVSTVTVGIIRSLGGEIFGIGLGSHDGTLLGSAIKRVSSQYYFSLYEINSTNGFRTQIGDDQLVSTAGTPRGVGLTSVRGTLMTSIETADSVQLYSVDPATAVLTAIGSDTDLYSGFTYLGLAGLPI